MSTPAEAYWQVGSLVEHSARLDHRIDELSRWWADQDRRAALHAAEGPFAGEPGAAVAVAVGALDAARAACADLHAALERAQMATADLEPALAPPGGPTGGPRRHGFWRR